MGINVEIKPNWLREIAVFVFIGLMCLIQSLLVLYALTMLTAITFTFGHFAGVLVIIFGLYTITHLQD